jgi:class 3 adenylate cyclase/tetratricopeptide (TPR) repeat protein
LCTSCGFESPPGFKFCGQCAEPLGGAMAKPAAAEPPERDPRAYTPKHLADKILQSKSALEGERKQVTVLFADVKGSMELAGELDPEQWHGILDRFFTILADGVHRFEGTVNQYTGDGVMALFGAPIAHEDHAQRACYAALHLRDEIARYATEVKREHGIGFSTRMGIHSGDVVVGKIGDDLRMDYTAQGHSVGLAQRMESLASPDSCYMTDASAALAGGYFDLEDLGEFRVKGVAEPVRVHQLKGLGAARTRFDVSRARGLSRFVGRAADMRTLDDALEQSAAGNGQVVGVVAQAGTGKSRLCFEFLERCRARGMGVFEGRAVAHGKNIPFLPILEVFRAYFGITSEDDDRGAREKIAGRMVVLDQSFAEALPLLFDFLGVADPARPTPRLEPEARQRQILAVMRQVIQSVSEGKPTITLIEDLHWIDAASEEFLEQMVEAQSGSQRLLLLNFRPEYHADWMQKSWYRQIPLTPLGKEAIAELLGDLLGSDASIAALAEPIHERTGGNPFFTEEVAQTLIESGQLAGEPGAYRLETPIERLEVPATVHSVLAARIDRLPEREKRLLQVASVIGKDFPEPLLAEVADLPDEDLKSALAALRRAEFLHEAAIFPVAEYSFKHPLTQEVALGSQLRERRRTVHAAVARAIESRDAEQLEERAALLAHHYEEAGEALPAARWHRRAAVWVAATDVAASIHHWQRVRAQLSALPEDREAATLGMEACTQLLNWSWRMGMESAEARALLVEGEGYADTLGDPRARARIAMVYSRTLGAGGDIRAYMDAALEYRRIALELEDMPMQANAWGYWCDSHGFAGLLSEVLAVTEEGFARFPRDIPREEWSVGASPHAWYSIWRAFSLVWMGRLQEGVEENRRGVRLSEEDGTPEITAYLHSFSTEAFYWLGDAERTLEHARRTAELAEQLGEHQVMQAHAGRCFAYAHLLGGRPADAAESARTALEIFGRTELQHEGMACTPMAEALLQAGDLDAAKEAAERAIAFSKRSLRANYEAWAHGVLARALLRLEGAPARAAAEAALAEAEAVIERVQADVLRPAMLEWRAELARAGGDDAAEQRLLNEAREGYRSLGAIGHADRITRQRGA